MGKFLLQSSDELGSNTIGQVEFFVIVSLFSTAVSSNGRHIEHSISKFNESTSLYLKGINNATVKKNAYQSKSR